MTQLLIGLAGLARTGKSTVAKHLELAHDFQCYAFADPLREGLMQIFNLSPCDFEGSKKEEQIDWLGRSPRELMQLLGTEFGRNMVHPDLWLMLADQNLHFLEQTNACVAGFVISDLRFENEAAFIRRRGGYVIHLQRPDAPEVHAHVSELGIVIQDTDLVVCNDGGVEDMTGQIDELLKPMIKRLQRAA